MFYSDLHGLRGIAVILVCLFHFFEPLFPGGFRGVDIFFVLSGYLVTHSTFSSFSSSTASQFLTGFYSRRFARIFPSLIVVSFFSLILGLVFVLPYDGKRVILDYFTSNLGVFNIRLFNENLDYFRQEQGLNFFTQTWSLGVEEQFYIVFSILFLILISFIKQRKAFIGLLVVLTLISFAANFVTDDISAKFYLLKFRYWEIGIGSLLYFFSSMKKFRGNSFLDVIFFITLVANLFLHPYRQEYLLTLVITILPTLYFIATKGTINSKVRGFLNQRWLQVIATISYTLYLVHWPISVFLNYASEFNIILGIAGLGVSIVTSYFLYFKFEERALIYFKNRPLLSVKCLLACVFLCVVGFFTIQSLKFETPHAFSSFRRDEVNNIIRHYKCYNAAKTLKNPYEECLGRGDVEQVVYLLGDSHSSAMYPAFNYFFGNKLRHVVLKTTGAGHQDDIFRSYQFYDKDQKIGIFDYILKDIRNGDYVFITFSMIRVKGNSTEENIKMARLYNRYLKEFKHKGGKVIFLQDLPTFKYRSVMTCAFRKQFLGDEDYCTYPKDDLLENRKEFDFFFSHLDFKSLEGSIELFDLFCRENICSPYVEGQFSFSDNNHLTLKGSLRIAEKLKQLMISQKVDPSIFQ